MLESPSRWSILSSAVAFVLVLAQVVPAAAGYFILNAPLDEINEHASLALVASFLGDHGFLGPGSNAVSGYGGFGADDPLSATIGASWQNTSLLPFGWGVSYAYVDAEFETHTFALDARYPLTRTAFVDVIARGALAYQIETAGGADENIAFYEHGAPLAPDNPLMLVDDVAWMHGYLQLAARARIGPVRPQLDVGWLGTHYDYDGRECPNGDCSAAGPAASRSGTASRVVTNAGLGFDFARMSLFAGLGDIGRDVVGLGRVTVAF
jgi:hypothetical protein